MKPFKETVRSLLRGVGLEVSRYRPDLEVSWPLDFSPEDIKDISAVRPFTMTTPERVVALIRAVEYIEAAHIPGAIVECGVWKGGSMMAVARTLKRLGSLGRDLWLYDTFEGMPKPIADDVDFKGDSAAPMFEAWRSGEDSSSWCCSPLAEVEQNVGATGYPRERIRFVKGKVEDTVPGELPDRIALLRLDTDWYESTKHELVHMYPRLVPGGVLIIDDYGFWKGARKAVDEFFAEIPEPLLLNRIDHTGRVAVKR